MIKILRRLLLAGFASSFLVLSPVVLAVDSTTSTAPTSSSSTNTPLKQRIEQRRNELKAALSAAEQDKIKLKCKAAQTIVGKASDNVGQFAPEREKNYQQLQDSLTTLIAKIKAANIDTTTLEQEKTTLSNKASQIKTDFDAYKQQLADLKDMDCVTDPSGFKGALEATRTSHATLVKEIADIKAYVVNTIKPTLVVLRKQLPAAKTETQGTN